MGRLRVRRVVAALLVVLTAPAFFVVERIWLGLAFATAGLVVAWALERAGDGLGESGGRRRIGWGAGTREAAARAPSLLRDLALIAIGLAFVRSIPLAAELDDGAMLRFAIALGGAVAAPYALSRFVFRDRAIGFPWRGAHGAGAAPPGGAGDRPGGGAGAHGAGAGGAGAPRRWGVFHWAWLGAVLVLGWLILPWYFISSGVYRNWPAVDTAELVARLFVGVGAVGIWDELFFVCTVFALLRRHFPDRTANALQAVVFVSFLWELGYRAWGPLLTIPFALMQGIIFVRTRSLGYVVTVHLLFDAIVFAVLVHAHDPELFDVFVTAG